ncbi:MAG: hypothetical protein JO257_04010 [Deltaproteobacteria bacterium]|nr:hypothetical protein [Deltaproteobacteria bacterium]
MRALLLLVALSTTAAADPLPPGSLGALFGPTSGTGPDAKVIGAGYTFGAQAAWQPMNTDRRFGWALRWATLFGAYGLFYQGSAAQIESTLRTVQMDFTLGARWRPWPSPSSYLTLRPGVEVFRANEPLPPKMQRSFVGGIAEVGFEHYFLGTSLLLDIDVRYGLVGSQPSNIAVLFALSLTGP